MSDENFTAFWFEYPRKVSKGAAMKAYDKAIKTTDHAVIMEGLKAYNAHLEEHPRERQFIKHASTWLNQMCWEDEHEAPQTLSDMDMAAMNVRWKERYDKDPKLVPVAVQKIVGLGPYAKGAEG